MGCPPVRAEPPVRALPRPRSAATAAARCRPHLRELVPCHCTAAGKALLAWRESWREAVLAQPLDVVHRAHEHRARVAAPRARAHGRARVLGRGPRVRGATPAGSPRPSSARPARPWPRSPWSRRSSRAAGRSLRRGGRELMRVAAALSRELGFVGAQDDEATAPPARPGGVAVADYLKRAEAAPARSATTCGGRSPRCSPTSRRGARRCGARVVARGSTGGSPTRSWSSRTGSRRPPRLFRGTCASTSRSRRRACATSPSASWRRSPTSTWRPCAAYGSAIATCRSTRSARTCRAAATRCSPRRS